MAMFAPCRRREPSGVIPPGSARRAYVPRGDRVTGEFIGNGTDYREWNEKTGCDKGNDRGDGMGGDEKKPPVASTGGSSLLSWSKTRDGLPEDRDASVEAIEAQVVVVDQARL